MKILGFNCFGHDSAVALIDKNEIVFAIEEERLSRKKHDGSFPKLALNACLENTNTSSNDIKHIAFFWNPKLSILNIPVYFLKFWNKVPSLLKEQKDFSIEENLGMINYLKQMFLLPKKIRTLYNLPTSSFKFHYVNHHLCHAASAYYPSNFTNAAILTIDGAGEWATTMLAEGKGATIKKLHTINTPYSVGAFYQAIAIHLGFKLIEGPGKLMGLASYGNKESEAYFKLKNVITLLPNGKYSFDMSYFSYHYTRKSGVTQKFNDLFGTSKRIAENWSEHELNLAAAAQRVVEDIVLHLVTYLKQKTNSENLCLAGGVALNSVSNGIIAKSGLFKNIYIQPAAGDSGTALGAALYVHHIKLKQPRIQPMQTAFLGIGYSDQSIEDTICFFKLKYKKLEDIALTQFAATAINTNKIVAWFQGKDEFGPRALGNRSILANPTHPKMKDILNERVKFRESFRPFAAMVTQEDCGTYFDFDYPNPYMLLVYNVKENYTEKLPSITHIDGTCRIQTVNEQENPKIYNLLCELKKLNGFPIVVNTSFNIKGEPIVSSPTDAIESFLSADIDFLILGNYVLSKN
ncbi:carbamoyltransferase N-terminal domain-containing protein [Flavobacterium sp.]|uniref:carbamoyltransferase family protein n=1 Tax=Flavobacterium sp. TaxID=239 RepID=UPI0032653C79